MSTDSMSFGSTNVGIRSPARSKLLILVGAILALVGVSVPFVTSTVLVLVPWSVGPFAIPALYAAVGAIGSLLLGSGGFLIFLGFAQARRDSLPWTLVVAVVMITAGATGALAGGMLALLWLSSPSFGSAFNGSFFLFSFVEFAAGVALDAALIVGLLALARTFLRNP